MSDNYSDIFEEIEVVQKQFSVFASNMAVLAVQDGSRDRFSEVLELVDDIKATMDSMDDESGSGSFERVRNQIHMITGSLNDLKTDLLVNIGLFDQYAAACLQYIEQIENFIDRCDRVDSSEQTENKAPVSSGILQNDTDRFQKKVYDLRLTRQVMQQLYTQIKLVQKNNKMAYEGTNRLLLNTVPVLHISSSISLGIEQQKNVLRHQQAINETAEETFRNMNEILSRPREAEEEVVLKVAKEISQEVNVLMSSKKGSYLDTENQLKGKVDDILAQYRQLSANDMDLQ